MSTRHVRMLGGLTALGLALAACGSSGGGGSASSEQAAPAAGALDKATGVTKVAFWHGMSGTNAEVLTKLVDEFNAAHTGKIQVDATYAGNYDDTITKYKASIQSKATPDVVQIYDIGTRFMIDAKQAVPMQAFIDRDKMDVSDLQPNIAGYYTTDKKLNSMPFNTSMPVLYYNKTMFQKAGLDPNKPPTTIDEIKAASQKLVKANGGPVDHAFGAAIYGWFIEQFLATAGDQYCDQDNGRSALATKVLFDQPDAVKLVTWWQGMIKDGLAVNTGRDTKAAQTAFTSQQVAIHIESTGSLGSYTKAAAAGGFELGVANYPKLKAGDGGPIIGGASLWINGVGHADAQKEASWEFVKFLADKKSQATWHTGTGYFPISKGALDEPVDKAYRDKNPLFNVAVKQLQDTPLNTATQGCALGVMPQARKASEDGLEKVLNGGDPQKSMTDAATGLQGAIQQYNSSVK